MNYMESYLGTEWECFLLHYWKYRLDQMLRLLRLSVS